MCANQVYKNKPPPKYTKKDKMLIAKSCFEIQEN